MSPALKIAVLMGGPGSEREVSLASGNAVLRALAAAGHDAVAVDVTATTVDLPPATGLAFNLIHGTFGEDGEVQAQLEALGVPYTGAGVESSRLAFDKHLSKQAFLAAGVPTPRSETIAPGTLPSLPCPLVVKPTREGSSVGVHIVRDPAALAAALADASRFGSTILIEEFIEGRELTVAILDDTALPVVHIIPPAGVYDMDSKYPWLSGKPGSQYVCPAEIGEAATRAVQEAAIAAHRSLAIEVYSRVDVLLDARGRPFVLEANTIPGMTETSLLPKSAAAAGIDFSTLCLTIAARSLELRPPQP